MCVLKKVLLLLFFISSTTFLIAQVSIGFRGGISLPELSLNSDGYYSLFYDDIETPVFMGSTLGAICEIKLHQNFALQPELMYLQKGSKVLIPGYYYYNSGNEETKLRLNYLELPILAKGMFGNESVTGYATLGPSLGYAITGYLTQFGVKETLDDNDWDGFNRFEVSVSFGVGAGLALGEGQAFVDLRYLLGLNNIIVDFEDSAKHRVIGITVGYLKYLGKGSK